MKTGKRGEVLSAPGAFLKRIRILFNGALRSVLFKGKTFLDRNKRDASDGQKSRLEKNSGPPDGRVAAFVYRKPRDSRVVEERFTDEKTPEPCIIEKT